MKDFNVRIPPYSATNAYGLKESDYAEMRAVLLISAIKRHDSETVAAMKANEQAFAAIFLLCDDKFLTTLEGLSNYASVNKENNPIALMKL